MDRTASRTVIEDLAGGLCDVDCVNNSSGMPTLGVAVYGDRRTEPQENLWGQKGLF